MQVINTWLVSDESHTIQVHQTADGKYWQGNYFNSNFEEITKEEAAKVVGLTEVEKMFQFAGAKLSGTPNPMWRNDTPDFDDEAARDLINKFKSCSADDIKKINEILAQ